MKVLCTHIGYFNDDFFEILETEGNFWFVKLNGLILVNEKSAKRYISDAKVKSAKCS